MRRAIGKERVTIIDGGVVAQEAVHELREGVRGCDSQLGGNLFDGLQIVVDDGLTRDDDEVAALLWHVCGGGVYQCYRLVCCVFRDYRERAKCAEPDTGLLLEITDWHDCAEFTPLGGPRLVVLEQPFVHTSAQ